ncbi:hypothetical protein LLEC1_07062 [Akanthomyces lecanii]|uniref:Uncharacterized protein n=1 Tax=Cordyceps confragosa TaxID=2714763 RepID=A0A179I3F7_CORDF|nr:hypothetical protein LLEC1_07062 [Akanthomyces lecanii]
MYDGQERLDDAVWDKNEEEAEKGMQSMRLKTKCRRVEELVREKFGGEATFLSPIMIGGFNVLYRVHVDGRTPDVVVRLPLPALVQFADEKTVQEAATAIKVAECTAVPIPRVLSYGSDSVLGPFLIMDFVEHKMSVSARLNAPRKNKSAPHILDPKIPAKTLQRIWTKVADGQLQLSKLRFDRIGALTELPDGTIGVGGRPLTHNMTDMIRLANIPRTALPPEGTTYSTADDWYTALAEMNIAQLVFQHNDVITSADDCRNKYVARQIFRRLARKGQLASFGFKEDTWSAQATSGQCKPPTCPMPPGTDSFRLWGDDFRAGNILLTKNDEISAFIDWEYTYVAPTQFILDPPWWLLLETAEMWHAGIVEWVKIYGYRIETWLAAVQEAEAALGEYDALPLPLSTYMRESWETGRFFLSYATRKSWAFDVVYWRCLDEKFFGPRQHGTVKEDLWKTRIDLLTEAEREAMEPFVERKMAEKQDRRIVDRDPVEAREYLDKLLFD